MSTTERFGCSSTVYRMVSIHLAPCPPNPMTTRRRRVFRKRSQSNELDELPILHVGRALALDICFLSNSDSTPSNTFLLSPAGSVFASHDQLSQIDLPIELRSFPLLLFVNVQAICNNGTYSVISG